MAKSDFWPKTEILGQKKHTLFRSNHVLATTGKKLFKEKSNLFHNKYQFLKQFWVFFAIKRISGKKTLLGQKSPEKLPIERKRNFFGGGLDGKNVAPDILVICPVDKNHDYHTKN